ERKSVDPDFEPKRAKALLKNLPAPAQSTDPLERAANVHALVREIFKRQGEFIGTVELRRPDGEWEVFTFVPEDKRDKYLVWHLLGRKVLAGRHDALIFSGEMWAAPMTPEVGPYYTAEDAKGRKE